MKGDDGVGPFVASRLQEEWSKNVDTDVGGTGGSTGVAVDCGTTPENYTAVVRRLRPELLVIVDAAQMGLEPGACRIIPGERVGVLGLSTHSMPLTLFMSYVGDLVIETVLVGVQPESMALGAVLSPQVAAAAEGLVARIVQGKLDGLPVLN